MSLTNDHPMSQPTETPVRYRHKPSLCPQCGSPHIASLLYGTPPLTDALQRAIAEGRIRLGGATLSDADAAWECADWGAPLYPERDGEQIA
jgi:hypothetical protein